MDKETLGLFEDALQRFNRERHGPAQWTRKEGPDLGRRHWRELAELGWFELAASDESRPEIVPLLSIYRAAGEGLWREPLHCVFGPPALVAASAEPHPMRRRLRDGLASGHLSFAYADREPGEAGACGMLAARAPQSGDEGVVLTGRKVAVIDDGACSGYLVSACDAVTGVAGCYLVDGAAQGVGVVRYRTLEGQALSDLTLEQARGTFVCPLDSIALARDWAVLLATAECVGIMQGALRDTLDYLRQRRQFGRPLIDFQVLQHRLADMSMLMRETDAVLLDIAEDLDAGSTPDRRRLLCLRAVASRAVRHVTREALQMHGGMGITQECRVSHYYRRALTLESLYGSEAWALEELAAL